MFNPPSPPVQRKSSQGIITALSIGQLAAPNVTAQIDAFFSVSAALGIERAAARVSVCSDSLNQITLHKSARKHSVDIPPA